MMRLILLLALGLGQAQPVAAALLCEQHHVGAGEAHGRNGEHHATPTGTEPTAPVDHDCSPMPHDCTAMTSCSITTMAIAPLPTEVAAQTAVPLAHTSYLLDAPPVVDHARPFHPPKA